MRWVRFVAVVAMLAAPMVSGAESANTLTPEEKLGKDLFFDVRLSSPAGMACASCHSPQRAFSDPQNRAFSEGVHKGRFAGRNAPTLMYLAEIPPLYFDKKENEHEGGLFLDGRVNTLEDQVSGPLLHPAEMANADKHSVIKSVRDAGYAPRFKAVYGSNVLDEDEAAFTHLARALASYERSVELNPFTSKYDFYLKGKARLTAQEQRGLKLFEDEKKGNCAACHPSALRNDFDPPLFTDFSYDNLGVPANRKSAFYRQPPEINPDGEKFVDIGLGKTLKNPALNGKFRAPTLRNIAVTAPYMHNGVFNTLEEVVEFYSTRETDKRWGKPEVAENINRDELGNLKLTKQEITDIVAFLKVLTDGYKP